MVYTLTQGARGYNSRLHYSLYGGVEYWPDRSLAIKELLPLAAIPAAAITILAAIFNFHVPAINAPAKAGTGSPAGSVFSFQRTQAGNNAAGNTSKNTSNTKSNATSAGITPSSAPVAVTTDNFLPGGATPSGSPGSLVGGMGGGGGDTAPGGSPQTLSASDPTNTIQASASVSGTTAQVGVDVFSPVSGKPLLSSSTTLDP